MSNADYIQGSTSNSASNGDYIQGVQPTPDNTPRIAVTDNPLDWSYTTVHMPHTDLGAGVYGAQEGASNLTEGVIQRAGQLGELARSVSPEQEQQIENNINSVREKQAEVYKQNFDEGDFGETISRKVGNIVATLALTSPLMMPGKLFSNIASNAGFAALQPTTEPGESLTNNIIANEALGVGTYGLAAVAAKFLPKVNAIYAPRIGGAVAGGITGYYLAPDNPEAKAIGLLSGTTVGGLSGNFIASKIRGKDPLNNMLGEQKYVENYEKFADPQKVADAKAAGIDSPLLLDVAKTGSPLAANERRMVMSPELQMQLANTSAQHTQIIADNLRKQFEDIIPWTQEEQNNAYQSMKDVQIPNNPDSNLPGFINPNKPLMAQTYLSYRSNKDPEINPPGSLYDLQTFKRTMQDVPIDTLGGRLDGETANQYRIYLKNYADSNYPQFTDIMNKSQQFKFAQDNLAKFDEIKSMPQQNSQGPLAAQYYAKFFGTPEAQKEMLSELNAATVKDPSSVAQQAQFQSRVDKINAIKNTFANQAAGKSYQIPNRVGEQESNVNAHSIPAQFLDWMRRSGLSAQSEGYFRPILNPSYKTNLLEAVAARNAASRTSTGLQSNLLPLVSQAIARGIYNPTSEVTDKNNNK